MSTENIKEHRGTAATAGRLKRLVMHLFMMFFGLICYWILAMAMPTKWWFTKCGWFWWSVPIFGYYAYHPHDLRWWQQAGEAK